MKYITVLEASEKWGINERRVRALLKEQRIEGAILKGHKYFIPENAPKPLDRRIKGQRLFEDSPLKDINFDKDPEKVFKDICKENNSNRITFKEFINFYELLVTGEEFEEVFQKYSKDEDKKYISIKGLIEFFDKEQNEILYPEDAIKLICKYSSKAKKMHKSALEVIESLIKKKQIKINRKKIQNQDNSDSENFDENISNVMNLLTKYFK